MADNIDDAQELNEFHLKQSLEKQLNNRREIPFFGSCLYCEEPIDKGRFCSPECRVDWEKKLKRR